MKKSIVSLFSTILIFTTIFSSTAIAASPVFADTGSHWAKDYIDYLTTNGAIKGYTDGTFKPENKISRAEFTAILLRALKNDVGQPKEGKWYSNYITEATNRKYILSGEFDSVEKNITRGEMARMIVRTMTEAYPENMSDYASQLNDYNKMPAAYKDFALKAYVKGIITGRPGGIFAYAEPATRAEATTMIVRLIDETKRIIPSEPESNNIYLPQFPDQKEIKVETSHSELLPHIKKGLEILSTGLYSKAEYAKEEYNQITINAYKDKSEVDDPIWESHPVLGFIIYTEKDPREETYLPYQISLYDTANSIGQQKFRELIKDVFPEAYDKINGEFNKKIEDKNYQGSVWEKINGREIRAFTFEGHNQIDVYITFEN